MRKKRTAFYQNNVQVFLRIRETQTGIQLGLITSKTKEEMKNEFDRFNKEEVLLWK